MTRYLNIYPDYIGVTVYETYDAAREACGDLSGVKTIKLVENSTITKNDHDRNVIEEDGYV